MKLRCCWGVGYSQGLVYLRARDGGTFCCRADLGAATHVQEQGWEGKRGRACRGRGDQQ